MSMIGEVFEIEPFRHEFEQEARFARGAPRAPRGPRGASKPWPSFRQRRISRTPSIYGGWGGYAPVPVAEPQAEPEPASAAPSEHVRWLQSTLNRAIGGALPIDGVMSAAVRSAIREFQRKNRLPVSGYVGPDTDAALRRVKGSAEIGELEFETEFELPPAERMVDSKLWDDRRRMTFRNALDVALTHRESIQKRRLNPKSRPKPLLVQGLYRIFSPPNALFRNGGFYTGCSTNFRKRMLQHRGALADLGVDHRGYKVALVTMEELRNIKDIPTIGGEPDIREIERRISRYHRSGGRRVYDRQRTVLNPQEELEFLELSDL